MSTQKHYDAIIIGAGVSGLYQLHRLRQAGFSVCLYEKAAGVGGTWYWNRYPGCRFDSESYTYAYSFSKELLEEWNWSEHFAGQPETLAYLNHVADKLVPSAHDFGQRRVPMETNYYEAYNQDNVQLVDLNETPIERITATGVKTSTDEFEFDLIIYATGFDAGTGAISRIDVRGTNGESIKDKWAKELRTNMGLQVAGFPNMFIHIGPHAAFCNIPRCAQVSVDWVSDLIEYMRTKKMASVEPTEAAEIGWTEHAVEEANKTLLSKTNSWIMGDNVAGKPRALLLYAGPLPQFRQRMKDCAANGYEGFRFTR